MGCTALKHAHLEPSAEASRVRHGYMVGVASCTHVFVICIQCICVHVQELGEPLFQHFFVKKVITLAMDKNDRSATPKSLY